MTIIFTEPDRTAASHLGADLDRILELRPGRSGVALCNVAGTLPLFSTHFPRYPILPGVLMLESMAALAAAAAGGPWRLSSVRGLRFRQFVVPGDQVIITVDLLEHAGDTSRWKAEARVEGRLVASARSLEMSSVEPEARP
ncbi:3-hydroxyacyl-ACP dehydratase FabZ family protein [Nocardia sp. NPDC058497]|uniref:3-hydroxyacyl-ACP dehydratase FabZ family protein n=1 Tax=Nocardia sp. NPDC058497 TaxID=3346529 RepID=UPI003664BBF0